MFAVKLAVRGRWARGLAGITLLAVTPAASVSCSAEETARPLRTELKRAVPAAAAAPDGLRAHLRIDTVQSAGTGIRYEIELANGGTQPLSVTNPRDSFWLSLSQGSVVLVSRATSQSIVRVPETPAPPPEVLKLDPGTTHRLPVVVSRWWRDGRSEQPASMAPGTYEGHVSGYVTVTSDSTPARAAFVSDSVSIRVTP
jgi:hypothetical protein